jgi:hypothetical protein
MARSALIIINVSGTLLDLNILNLPGFIQLKTDDSFFSFRFDR